MFQFIGHSEALKYKSFKFGSDAKGNRLVAHDPKELARLMAEYPDLGRKHLYRGTVAKWLQESGNQELFVEIADIIEFANEFVPFASAGVIAAVADVG